MIKACCLALSVPLTVYPEAQDTTYYRVQNEIYRGELVKIQMMAKNIDRCTVR
jgi:hypothetical protein